MDELRRHTATEGVPLVLIANKMDIYDEEKHISFDMVEKYRDELVKQLGDRFDIKIVKTSAKTGMNVKEAFRVLRESITKWVNEDEQ